MSNRLIVLQNIFLETKKNEIYMYLVLDFYIKLINTRSELNMFSSRLALYKCTIYNATYLKPTLISFKITIKS